MILNRNTGCYDAHLLLGHFLLGLLVLRVDVSCVWKPHSQPVIFVGPRREHSLLSSATHSLGGHCIRMHEGRSLRNRSLCFVVVGHVESWLLQYVAGKVRASVRVLSHCIPFIQPIWQVLWLFSLILHAEHVPPTQKLSKLSIRWLDWSYLGLELHLTLFLRLDLFISVIQNLILLDDRNGLVILKALLLREGQVKKSGSHPFVRSARNAPLFE